MKVWIVVDDEPEGGFIYGVFSTQEKADRHVQEMRKNLIYLPDPFEWE